MLDDGTATDYDSYSTLYFTATGTGDSQTWAPNTDVVLTETKGTLYAYYPHDGNVDISAIPVDMTAADQTDWLYATPVADVNEDKASVAVTLNHALANINVSLVKGSYVGTGNVTAISVKSDGIAPKGTFNAAQATPNYTAFEDEGAALERTVTTTLGGTATDIMVVPTGSSATITFNVTVDGTVYTATSAAVELEKGSSYKYTLTLNSTFMSVSDVAVSPWNVVTKESLTLEKPSPWASLANGVYAVAADGSPVEVANATTECIAVALIVNDAPTPQRLMITMFDADNGESSYYDAQYYLDRLIDCGLSKESTVDGTNTNGWFDGTGTPRISKDYTTWTSGALSDFNGKVNTIAIVDLSSKVKEMGKVLETYNSGTNNQSNRGYTDWYIPACGQLSLMYLNKTAINNALTKIGGQTIASFSYWSSSEYDSYSARNLDFSFGTLTYSQKNYGSRVRFVRDIN